MEFAELIAKAVEMDENIRQTQLLVEIARFEISCLKRQLEHTKNAMSRLQVFR